MNSLLGVPKPNGSWLSLEEEFAVHYDIAADFAVLCSNCHRMIAAPIQVT
jgi:hypothetical protein